jgi:hypothetical protein
MNKSLFKFILPLIMASSFPTMSLLHAMKKEEPTPEQQLRTRIIYKAQQDSARMVWQARRQPISSPDLHRMIGQHAQETIKLFQRLNKPIGLHNPGYECSYNALIQVLWVLTPLNTTLAKLSLKALEKCPVSSLYLESIAGKKIAIQNKRKLYSVLNFINAIDNLATQEQSKPVKLADPYETWSYFIQNIPQQAQDLFSVNYERSFSTEEDLLKPRVERIRAFNIDIDASSETTDIQKKLDNSYTLKKDGWQLLRLITPTPPILVIQTNRGTLGSRESAEKTEFPVTLPFDDLRFCDSSYYLVGIVFHTGSSRGGHYYSWVRQNNVWYKCNDDKIKQLKPFTQQDIGTLENYFDALCHTHLLFYLKR